MENDYTRFIAAMQQLVSDSIASAVPSDIVIGEVTAVEPLVVELENKLPIPAENILLTKNTCEWSVDMTVDHNTDCLLYTSDAADD